LYPAQGTTCRQSRVQKFRDYPGRLHEVIRVACLYGPLPGRRRTKKQEIASSRGNDAVASILLSAGRAASVLGKVHPCLSLHVEHERSGRDTYPVFVSQWNTEKQHPLNFRYCNRTFWANFNACFTTQAFVDIHGIGFAVHHFKNLGGTGIYAFFVAIALVFIDYNFPHEITSTVSFNNNTLLYTTLDRVNRFFGPPGRLSVIEPGPGWVSVP